MALFLSIFFAVQAFSAIFAPNYLISRMRYTRFCSTLILLFACVAMTSQAENLATYYAGANNKKGADLKTALYGIIHNHTNIGYDGLLSAYHETDKRADGYLRDWYSNATNYVIGGPKENHSYSGEGDGYNREHLVPQSWFGSGEMKSDLVQVVPSDGYVNNRRGNYPLGENNGGTWMSANGYSKLGACTVSGYSGQCFEPNDEVKGDIARVYFYVLACYENLHPNWNGGSASQVFDGKKYPGLKDWALKMFLRWAKQDPVDDVERARNEAVYKWQKNRNPFIDYPSLCEYVWGDSVSYAFDVSLPHGQGEVVIPDDPDPDDPNPDDPDPDNPNPDDPVTPDNPGAHSGCIVFSQCTWTSEKHPTYGNGYTATANGLKISYYTNTSQNGVIKTDAEVRLYKGAVLLIEGAEVTGVVFHAYDSKLANMSIDGKSYEWQDKATMTWTGSMNPFLVMAQDGQSRIASMDVTIAEPLITGVEDLCRPSVLRLVFDEQGRYVGHSVPARRGIYLIREGERTIKSLVK